MSPFDWKAGLQALGFSLAGVVGFLAIVGLVILLYREVYFHRQEKERDE